MSKLERYEMATVDPGYHVYLEVWDDAVGFCLASEREATFLIATLSPLPRIMTRTLVRTPPYSMKNFRFENFRELSPAKDSRYIVLTMYMHN